MVPTLQKVTIKLVLLFAVRWCNCSVHSYSNKMSIFFHCYIKEVGYVCSKENEGLVTSYYENIEVVSSLNNYISYTCSYCTSYRYELSSPIQPPQKMLTLRSNRSLFLTLWHTMIFFLSFFFNSSSTLFFFSICTCPFFFHFCHSVCEVVKKTLCEMMLMVSLSLFLPLFFLFDKLTQTVKERKKSKRTGRYSACQHVFYKDNADFIISRWAIMILFILINLSICAIAISTGKIFELILRKNS